MNTFLINFKYTNEGVRKVKQSVDRIDELKLTLQGKFGVTIQTVFMATSCDTIFIVTAEKAADVKAAELYINAAENVRVDSWQQIWQIEDMVKIANSI